MLTDLGHPALAAQDVGRTLEFYAPLGIEEAFRLHHDDGSLMLVYLHVSRESFIEVFPGGPPPDPDHPQSFMHLCLITDGIEAAVEHLRRNGAPIESETALGLDGNLQAWTRDPDGNEVELISSRRTRRSGGRPAPPPKTVRKPHGSGRRGWPPAGIERDSA